MKIILEINGWRKEKDVPEYLIYKGRIESILTAPLDIFVRDRDIVTMHPEKTIMFYYRGKTSKEGYPIFSYYL